MSRLPESAIALAAQHLRSILTLCVTHSDQHTAVVVFDSACPLAVALTAAYRLALPTATFIDFDASTPDAVLSELAHLAAEDLVVLIQSSSFRMNEFRVRVELFKRGLKVIEHPHLARMKGEESLYYIESLAYDPAYYRGVGNALKHLIDNASNGVLDSGGEQLVYGSAFESAKLNIGDYRGMDNIGGQFPIGEVFTEALDLQAVNGRVRIFSFGDMAYLVNQPETPITLVVNSGQVTDVINSTEEFDRVIASIKAAEDVVWVRELGFGMNRAFSKDRIVGAIGTYERMCGVHLSLGAKHGIYGKPGFKRRDGKFHVDVFAVTESVTLDDQVIYRDGAWCVDGVETTAAR